MIKKNRFRYFKVSMEIEQVASKGLYCPVKYRAKYNEPNPTDPSEYLDITK